MRILILFSWLVFTLTLVGQQEKSEINFDFHPNRTAKTWKGEPNLGGTQFDIVKAECYWQLDSLLEFLEGEIRYIIRPVSEVGFFEFALTINMDAYYAEFNGVEVVTQKLQDNRIGVYPIDKGQGPGQLDTIVIKYNGKPFPSGFGGYNTGETEFGNRFMYTLSQPYEGPNWWPGKHQLSDKIDSLFIQIITPNYYKAVANGRKITDSLDGFFRITEFEHHYPIDPYLVAIAVSKYEEENDSVQLSNINLPIKNYSYSGYEDVFFQELDTVKPILQLFDTLIGPYPFQEELYGHAMFARGGGMEHQTMSFMAHGGFQLVAHELAHQWFGDKLTCYRWGELWLNEGFATYFTGIAIEFIQGEEAFNNWLDRLKSDIVSQDWGSVFAYGTDKQFELFDYRQRYQKGALLLHSIRKKIGDEVFFNSLKQYLEEPFLKYDYTSTEFLIKFFEWNCDCNIGEFINARLYDQGHPYLDISVGKLTENQKFSINIEQRPSHPDRDIWKNSLTIRVFSNGDFQDLFIEDIGSEYYSEFSLNMNNIDSIQVDPKHATFFVLGEYEYLNSIKWEVNPTVTSSLVNIRALGKSNEAVNIELISSNGRIIRKLNGRINEITQLDISQIPYGIYIMRISSSSGVVLYKQKIVKQ